MIGFVVPIKPKRVSKDWDYDNVLLERTVRSICGQTDQQFKLVIVYNDLPSINFTHPNVIFLHYPFPPVTADQIEDLETLVLKYYTREYGEKMIDKGKKIHYGCKKAIEDGCEYMMSVDSDDLVSNKIAAFVNTRIKDHSPGWRIKKGFIYEEDSKVLMKKYDIQNINGSTHIIRKDLITIPDFSSNLFFNYNLFEAHGYTYWRLIDFHDEYLADYPSFGIIYIVHRNNYSNILNRTKARFLKKLLKVIVRGKLITNKLRKEYGLYNI